MSNPVFRLRPLGLSDLIDESLRLYRRNVRLFLSIGAPLFVPLGFAQLAYQIAITQPYVIEDRFGSEELAVDWAAALTVFAAFMLFLIMSTLIQCIYFITVTYAASESLLGNTVSVGQAYRAGFRRLGRILLLGGAMFIPLIPLFMLILIGWPFAIYLAISWMFAAHIIILEGERVFRSMGRSRYLVRGHWWRVLGIVVVIWMITSIVQSVFGFLVAPFSFASAGSGPSTLFVAVTTVVTVILQTAATIVVSPITYCCFLLLYYDLRVRKEGFDLELMAQEMIATPRPAGSAD